MRGFALGVLALALLDAFLTGPAPKNAGALTDLATGAIRRLVDPSVPLIPDRRRADQRHLLAN